MGDIIKTGIITIIISFISGLLLEYYKNLAPRILCNVKNAVPIKVNNEKISAYIITVNNVSNKTIHELTLNIQSEHNNLKIADAKITRGLKFNSSIKNNILDVHIPFLSKGDKFSVKVCAENQYEICSKPVITIRSPGKFRQINSLEQDGILYLLLNILKNIYQIILKILKKPKEAITNKKDDFTMVLNKPSVAEKIPNKEGRTIRHKNENLSNTKKAMITIVSIIFLVFVGFAGFLVKAYSKGTYTTSTPDVKTIVPSHSSDSTVSSGATKNTGSESSTKRTNENADSKTSTTGTNENTDSKASKGETNQTTGSKASKGETNQTTDSTTSSGGTNQTSNSTTSTGSTNQTSNSTTSSGGANQTTNSTTSSGGANQTTNSTTSSGGTNQTTNSTTSTGSANQTSNSTTSTGGTNQTTNSTTSSEGTNQNTNSATSSGGTSENTSK